MLLPEITATEKAEIDREEARYGREATKIL
jgi:hypothetical protein